MSVSPLTIDFSKIEDIRQHSSGKTLGGKPVKERPRSADGKLLTAKQIRSRARRRANRTATLSDQELEYLYKKPIDEWDLDELAQGRPRNSKGHFKGPKPGWITSAVHEESMAKYTAAVKTSMRGTTVDALDVLQQIIRDDNVDDKGKPIVAASVKLDAAKFLIEHVIGKPTQRIENDVSVKLQSILGQVMVNPEDLGPMGGQTYNLGHLPGYTMELATGNEDSESTMEEFFEEDK